MITSSFSGHLLFYLDTLSTLHFVHFDYVCEFYLNLNIALIYSLGCWHADYSPIFLGGHGRTSDR